MTLEEIAGTLTELFGLEFVQAIAPGSWQIETNTFRMLVLLSEDDSWLRVLLPIIPLQESPEILPQLLADNFDETQETRYALHDEVIWGVFQHNLITLTNGDLTNAISRLLSLYQVGVNNAFDRLIESRLKQIIQAAKQTGQSLEATMQNLDRFYAEGLLGEINQTTQVREQVLATWRSQLERLWDEI